MTENESPVRDKMMCRKHSMYENGFGSKSCFTQLVTAGFFYLSEFFSWSRAIASSMALLIKAVVLSAIDAACS